MISHSKKEFLKNILNKSHENFKKGNKNLVIFIFYFSKDFIDNSEEIKNHKLKIFSKSSSNFFEK